MYRHNQRLVFHPRVNFSLQHTSIGDVITTLPAIIHGRLLNPDMEMHVWVGDYLLETVQHLLAPYGEFTVVPGSRVVTMDGRGVVDGKRTVHSGNKSTKIGLNSSGPVIINHMPYDVHTRIKTDMVAFGFRCLLDTDPPDLNAMSYPTLAPLGPRTIEGPYVAVQAGYTAKNREFDPRAMHAVLLGILERGMRPVILGKAVNKMPVIRGDDKRQLMQTVTASEYDSLPAAVREACLDLREQTTVLQARDVLGHAEAVVGIDGGLLHLACTTDVPVVMGLTNTRVDCRIPVRYGIHGWRFGAVVPRDVPCQGCQSNWTLVFGYDFRTCHYKDYACVTNMSGDDLLAAMDGAIDAAKQEREESEPGDRHDTSERAEPRAAPAAAEARAPGGAEE